jgi:thiamine-phosphate pyrophosphorylase
MTGTAYMRIIDENLDRLAEGLRFLEDTARMLLNDNLLTTELKTLRHVLIRSDLAFNLQLLQSRDSQADVGETLTVKGEPISQDFNLLVIANARRAQEALRVLEDMAKLPEMAGKLDSEKFKTARFKLYSLEKALVSRLSRKEKADRLKGLYVIIDTQFLGQTDPLGVTHSILQAGVKLIQLRAKNSDKRALLQLALKMQKLCSQNEVLFIINDHLDIALAVEADGLHIGQEDLPASVARKLIPPNMLLGVSAATINEVREAESAGADYLGVGAIYPTKSKDDINVVGLDLLREIKKVTNLPLAAIGGIKEFNLVPVVKAGADSVCVISAVLGAPDICQAARHLKELVEVNNEKTD